MSQGKTKKQGKAGKPRKKATGPANKRGRARVVVGARERAAGARFAKLVALQELLYGPNGCPWDREQTHASLRKYLIEETYEVLDAMESGEARKFSDELGDLLLQVIFHAVLARERGDFTIADVIEGIYTKMVRRHPHVFGDVKAGTSAAVLKNWEQIKAEERAAEKNRRGASASRRAAQNGDHAAESLLSGVPKSLPGVLEAYQLTRRAARVGFDGPICGACSISSMRSDAKSRAWCGRRPPQGQMQASVTRLYSKRRWATYCLSR